MPNLVGFAARVGEKISRRILSGDRRGARGMVREDMRGPAVARPLKTVPAATAQFIADLAAYFCSKGAKRRIRLISKASGTLTRSYNVNSVL